MSKRNDVPELPKAHIRLFQREILKLMTDDELETLLSYLTPTQQEKLFKMLSNQKEYVYAKKLAFKIFSFLPESFEFFETIINRSRMCFTP